MSSGAVHKADRTRLEDVEAEILALERALNVLQTERSLIQERLGTYKYPVLTLPNEIVSEIFVHFLPAYPDCPPMTGLLSPTLLTHICRKWREIALTTPTLWRAIELPSDLDPIQRVHLFDSWLERSCFSPLSLKIDLYSPGVEIDVLQTLLPHRVRWEFLELNIEGDHLHILKGPTPLLRELHLRLDESTSSRVSLLEDPLLRTAILGDDAAASVILPWAQLTSLSLHRVYPRECTPILLQTSSLVHCELRLFRDHPDTIQPDLKIPYLKSLILVNEHQQAPECLNTFIVPALQKLEVPEMYIGTDPVTALTSFIAKAGCKLRDVRIPGPRYVSKALYCKAFPLISKFCFDDEGNEKVDRFV
ncbi:hypothetical protein C8R43DRAFT_963416 [Mycena crocata]|nr:hypothetical protein C8R43DRAFT_963416 [Mycena crocata]